MMPEILELESLFLLSETWILLVESVNRPIGGTVVMQTRKSPSAPLLAQKKHVLRQVPLF